MDKTTKAFVIGACSVVILGGLIVAINFGARVLYPIATEVARSFFPEGMPDMPEITYPQFIEEVQKRRISRVLLSPDRGFAVVVSIDGMEKVVQLEPDKDLLKLLTDNNVDIAVRPSR